MTRAHEPGEGTGWVEFVGVFYLVAGAFNLVAGIAALTRAELFDAHAAIYQHIAFWGWLWIATAVAQVLIGLFVLRRSRRARAWGLGFALAGMIIWFLAFGAYPLWGLILIVIYGLILYALTTYREYFS